MKIKNILLRFLCEDIDLICRCEIIFVGITLFLSNLPPYDFGNYFKAIVLAVLLSIIIQKAFLHPILKNSFEHEQIPSLFFWLFFATVALDQNLYPKFIACHPHWFAYQIAIMTGICMIAAGVCEWRYLARH